MYQITGRLLYHLLTIAKKENLHISTSLHLLIEKNPSDSQTDWKDVKETSL
jgi:hypothetical protein